MKNLNDTYLICSRIFSHFHHEINEVSQSGFVHGRHLFNYTSYLFCMILIVIQFFQPPLDIRRDDGDRKISEEELEEGARGGDVVGLQLRVSLFVKTVL